MNLLKRAIGVFSVMEEEVQSFRLLFLQSLFIGFANSYYYIVSSSMLIKNVGIKALPNAYIITGTAGFLLIQVYKRLQRKYGIPGSYKASLILFFLVCFMNFFAMSELGGNKAFSVFLAYFMVLFAAPFTAIFSLGLFAQCSRLFNIAQSKRLLALVLSGEIISSIIAYMSIPFISGFIKGREFLLLPVAGIFILFVFIPFNRLHGLARFKFRRSSAGKKPANINYSFFKKDRFYMLIAVSTVFSVFTIYVVDYAYLVSVRYTHEISGFEISEIVSVFFFVLKLGELTFSFLSGKILSNKGVMFSLLLLPCILLLFAMLGFISAFIFTDPPVFLLAFLFLAKLAERAIRKSVTTPSVKVMYQVAEPHERLEIESSIDGLLNQLATIASGVILLAVSVSFFGGDMFPMLRLISVVCIAAFALWSFFSFRLYERYRVKIRDFLSGLVTSSKPTHKKAVVVAENDAMPSDLESMGLRDKIDTAVESLHITRSEDLFGLIRVYNPKQSLDFRFEKEDKVIKRLVHIYFSNHHYFSRLLITKYMPFCSAEGSITFLRELWDVSDITVRLELILAFNERKQRHPDASFFERQCGDCVKEIIWTEASLNDTSELKDEAFDRDLEDHRQTLVRLLFELLKTVYEPSVISVIYDIIHNESGDMESRLFAVELLEITLHQGLKEMVIPLLEPVNFDSKRQKLGRLFHIYKLSARERLVDILMKDYNLVNLRLKEAALVLYNKVSDGKIVLSAFRTNNADNLKYKAEAMYAGFSEPAYLARLEILKRIEANYEVTRPYVPYLFNDALSVPKTNRFGSYLLKKFDANHDFIAELTASSNVPVRFDCLGLALLLSLKQVQPEHLSKHKVHSLNSVE